MLGIALSRLNQTSAQSVTHQVSDDRAGKRAVSSSFGTLTHAPPTCACVVRERSSVTAIPLRLGPKVRPPVIWVLTLPCSLGRRPQVPSWM